MVSPVGQRINDAEAKGGRFGRRAAAAFCGKVTDASHREATPQLCGMPYAHAVIVVVVVV